MNTTDDPTEKLLQTSLITCTVGNTHVKTVFWDEQENAFATQLKLTEAFLIEIKEQSEASDEADGLAQPFPIILAGTVQHALTDLEAHYRSIPNFEVFRFRKDLPINVDILPTPPEQVGDDRLASALGALAIDSKIPWVVIDSGTALTINTIRPGIPGGPFIFEGGLILPGEALSLNALHSGTDQLPAIEASQMGTPTYLGRSTHEAICNGVRLGQIASAIALAKGQLAQLAPSARIALTGGGGESLLSSIQEAFPNQEPVFDPLLVEKGLLALWNELE